LEKRHKDFRHKTLEPRHKTLEIRFQKLNYDRGSIKARNS